MRIRQKHLLVAVSAFEIPLLSASFEGPVFPAESALFPSRLASALGYHAVIARIMRISDLLDRVSLFEYSVGIMQT